MELQEDDPSVNTTNGISYIDNTERTETTPLQGSHNETKGLRVIISCLSVMTVIVSVALAAQMYYGDNTILRHGSVVTDNHYCSVIGAKIIRKGGNAVDAAVASTICMGVVQPHLTGIGGGGFMLIYDQRLRKLLECVDFRPSKSIDPSIGVPGFLAGLYTSHYSHGKLSWSEVVKDSIQIARTGYRVSESLANSVAFLKTNSSLNTPLKEWLGNLKVGSIETAPQLADTLETVANLGADVFYNGSLAGELLGHVLAGDLPQYRVGRGSCMDVTHRGYNIFVPGHGSGGPLLLQILSHLNLTESYDVSLLPLLFALDGNIEMNWQFGYGVQVGVVDDSDIYVSVVSGLGSVLGSQVLLPGGYILNNALDIGHVDNDNKPLSLALPVVCVEENQVCGRRLILGGSDTRDVVQLILQLLYTTNDVQSCVEAPRARLSSVVYVEDSHAPSFTEHDLQSLKAAGFQTANSPYPYPSLNTIQKISDLITAYADSRGQGEAITM